jgi:hypothetical protein
MRIWRIDARRRPSKLEGAGGEAGKRRGKERKGEVEDRWG